MNTIHVEFLVLPPAGDGAQGGADQADDDEEDDLLVVKRRDVLESCNPAAAAADGTPLGGVELRGNKKRKKLRIDPGRTSGARTVFDEAGDSLQPLALLAKEQLDRSVPCCPFTAPTLCCAVLCHAVPCHVMRKAAKLWNGNGPWCRAVLCGAMLCMLHC